MEAKVSGPDCVCPPSPALRKKILSTRRALQNGMSAAELSKDMLAKPYKDQPEARKAAKSHLCLEHYLSIVTRPSRTRAHNVRKVNSNKRSRPNPISGSRHALVILVDFDDKQQETEKSHFEELLFGEKNSLRHYYKVVSGGQLDVSGQVVDWIRAPKDYSEYTNGKSGFGTYPKNAQRLVEDVLDLLPAEVSSNLSEFVDGEDGLIDALFVVHAGDGGEETGDPGDIWSHRWSLPDVKVPVNQPDGKKIGVSIYTMEPENGKLGVFCHEFAHALGIPDLYDTDYDSSGVGDWCLMASGSWNDKGNTPAHMSAWCKYQLGWVNPKISHNRRDYGELRSADSQKDAWLIPHRDPESPEYFLIENRQKKGYDAALPGEGLLIWHVDESQHNNDDSDHYLVALEQADGLRQLEAGGNDGDSGDPFGAGNNKFTPQTRPNSKSYKPGGKSDLGSDYAIHITGISDSASVMRFDVLAGNPARAPLSDFPAEHINGVGAGRAGKLAEFGVRTIRQLALASSDPVKNTVRGLPVFEFSVLQARARRVMEFSLDTAISEIDEWTIERVLKSPLDAMVAATDAKSVDIRRMTNQLQDLAAALDRDVVAALKIGDL